MKKQYYWKSEYNEYKYWIRDSRYNRDYRRFCKGQYHKARRRHDKQIIEEELEDIDL